MERPKANVSFHNAGCLGIFPYFRMMAMQCCKFLIPRFCLSDPNTPYFHMVPLNFLGILEHAEKGPAPGPPPSL